MSLTLTPQTARTLSAYISRNATPADPSADAIAEASEHVGTLSKYRRAARRLDRAVTAYQAGRMDAATFRALAMRAANLRARIGETCDDCATLTRAL